MRLIRLLLLPLFALSLAACGALREPEAPSAPLEAIPLELATAPAEAPTESPSATPAPVETTATEEPAAVVEAVAPTATTAAPAGEVRIYSISQEQSLVRFELGEDLRGVRTGVTGITDQIAGELALNLADLASAQVGVIQINARGLATDNNFRNRAIHNDILQTGPFEFITFTPTAINGLPAAAAPGDGVRFAITGDLTLRNITQPVTFDVTATAESPDTISGTAVATVNRGDFDLRIPSVPNVANVDEEVRLTIQFVANATS
ncbi:MAG: YceI family protein [Anaerolineae bacterium]|nr:YceI family protein [Anaerolineae bacterium]